MNFKMEISFDIVWLWNNDVSRERNNTLPIFSVSLIRRDKSLSTFYSLVYQLAYPTLLLFSRWKKRRNFGYAPEMKLIPFPNVTPSPFAGREKKSRGCFSAVAARHPFTSLVDPFLPVTRFLSLSLVLLLLLIRSLWKGESQEEGKTNRILKPIYRLIC